jgi:hypothetical protein
VRPVLVQEQLRGRLCSGWLTDAVVGQFEGVVDEARTWHSGHCGDVLSPYVPTALVCCHSVRRGAAVAGMAAQG